MWKGLLFFLVSAAIIVIGAYSVTRVPLAVHGQKEPMPMEINYPDRVKRENAGMPSYIQIPTLYLYADVEQVKNGPNGKLDKPKDLFHVGMFAEENKRLGEKGVVVMAGDFDQENGRPGLFYYLNTLQKGDSIEFTDLNGKKFVYVVKDKAVYNWDSTDVTSLLNKFDSPRIDLIIYPAHTEENRNKDLSKTIIYAEIK